MKTPRTLLAALAFILHPSSFLLAQGPLAPPGAPAPTMKTLAQIEARTPISSAPFTISTPGSYYLTGNLAVSSGNAIAIAASGVTLDLNGFTISSTEATPTGTGILITTGLRDITIANGHIRGNVTESGGTFSGSGFAHGISFSGSAPGNVLVSRVSVSGCRSDGIAVGTDSTVVESCTVRTVGGFGIVASTVKASSARLCGSTGINADNVSDSWGESITASIGIIAKIVQNCYGYSDGNGNGVFADTAQNCYGVSSGNGNGVFASNTAQNCFGQSSTGKGVFSPVATGCRGISFGGGIGLHAEFIATNCLGTSSSGRGLVTAAATNCFGVTTTGDIALVANLANTCRAWQTDSVGVAINAEIAIGCNSAGGTITAGQRFLGTP